MSFDPRRFTRPQAISGTSILGDKPQHFDRTPTVVPKYPLLPKGGRFIKGPIPLEWLEVAIPLGRKALNVAMAIWYCYGFKQETEIKLTPTKLRPFRVTTETARTILHKFEAAGLVTVDRKQGRSPLVTIKPVSIQNKEDVNDGETTASKRQGA